MSHVRQCPRCGATLGAEAPDAVCSVCAAAERTLLVRAEMAGAEVQRDHPLPDTVERPIAAERPVPPRLDFLTPCDNPLLLGMLDKYEIVGVIGRGGMGVVLRGRDPVLNRAVAIKVLARELASNATAHKRFIREGKTAASVQHDHVVTIHSVEPGEKLPFLVMKCIEGPSLQEKIDKSGPLNVEHIARVGHEIALGLAAAHAKNLVHRDIKPSNILLEGPEETALITDFGLARAIDDVGITQTGVLTGTPQYMSPEQARGEKVDHRSDLFSLGCVLYAACTGRSPFRARTALAAVRRICDETPCSVRTINADIPEWLVDIIGKLLEKKPADRFPTAAEVGELLRRHWLHLKNPESETQPGSLRKGNQKIRGRVRLVAALLLLLVSATLVASRQPKDADRARTEVTKSDPSRAVASKPEEQQEKAGAEAKRLSELSRAVEQYPDQCNVWRSRGRFFASIGETKQAAADYTKAIELASTKGHGQHSESSMVTVELSHWPELFAEVAKGRPNDADLWTDHGRFHILQSQWRKALDAYNMVKSIRTLSIIPEEAYEYAALLVLINDVEGYRQFVRATAKDVTVQTSDEAYALVRMASLAPQALDDPRQALDWGEKIDKKVLWQLHTLGLAYYRAGEFQQAIEAFAQATNNSWSQGVFLNQFGTALCYLRLNQMQQATPFLEQAREERDRRTPGPTRSTATPPTDWLEAEILHKEVDALLAHTAFQ